MPQGTGIMDILNQAVPSLGLGQVESAQQVGVDDTLQRLIDLIMQPQEGPQAPEVRPAANTLSTIGDALAASAAGLTRNPGLRTQFVRDLQNRRAFEQQRLDQQSQRERQGQVQALGLQLGAEQEGLARTQRGKERAQAREDKIAGQGREERLIKEARDFQAEQAGLDRSFRERLSGMDNKIANQIAGEQRAAFRQAKVGIIGTKRALQEKLQTMTPDQIREENEENLLILDLEGETLDMARLFWEQHVEPLLREWEEANRPAPPTPAQQRVTAAQNVEAGRGGEVPPAVAANPFLRALHGVDLP